LLAKLDGVAAENRRDADSAESDRQPGLARTRGVFSLVKKERLVSKSFSNG
jgi:hypothetical protein